MKKKVDRRFCLRIKKSQEDEKDSERVFFGHFYSFLLNFFRKLMLFGSSPGGLLYLTPYLEMLAETPSGG